jgi:hypothetical protein
MIKHLAKIILTPVTLATLILIFPKYAFAHQPRIPDGNQIIVIDPEISKAYYSKLDGQPQIYQISSDKPFSLYVNILVPDIPGQKKDVKAEVFEKGNSSPLAVLDGSNFDWKKFFESFGHDTYWQGPEYKADVASGNYEVVVTNPNLDSKYSLAIGEQEAFDFKESANAIKLIPIIKRNFFNKSPADFILSPIGIGYIVILFFISFIFGFAYRFILKKFAKSNVRKVHKNIGKNDRLNRIGIGIILFITAITTSWSPILLFFSGFCFFESIFSWCGFYAAIGKNTCPI